MMSLHSVVIAEPVRTAIGTFGGTLKDVPAVELGATAISGALQRSGLRPEEIGTVVMGNAVQAGKKINPPRQATIRAGLPVQVPAMTVNRVCGSGAQAIVSAAHEILMGSVDTAVAGGMENMDAAPHLVARGRWGQRLGDGVLYDSVLGDGAQRCFLGRAFGLAYGGSGTEISDRAGRSRRMGAALTSALLRRAGRREIRRRNRARRNSWPQGPDDVFGRRTQPAGHDDRGAQQAEASLPRRRHDHGVQRARARHC